MATSEFVIVLTTLAADTEAVTFATTLVQERLAACVSVQSEMRSIYTWAGGIEQDIERQVVIKTTSVRVEKLRERVLAVHPYDVPEFLVIPVIDGSDAYLQWMRDCTTVQEGEQGESHK